MEGKNAGFAGNSDNTILLLFNMIKSLEELDQNEKSKIIS